MLKGGLYDRYVQLVKGEVNVRKNESSRIVKTLIPVGLLLSISVGYLGFLFTNSNPTLAVAAEGNAYKPVVSLEVVMEVVDDMFGSLKTTLNDKTAKPRKKFKKLKLHTAFIAEMMNLTAQFDSSAYCKQAGWADFAKKTQDLLLEASKAAKNKDGKLFEPCLEKIDAACEACHEKFRDI